MGAKKTSREKRERLYKSAVDVCDIVGINPPLQSSSTQRILSKLERAVPKLVEADFDPDQDFTRAYRGLHKDTVETLIQEGHELPEQWVGGVGKKTKKTVKKKVAETPKKVAQKQKKQVEDVAEDVETPKRPKKKAVKKAAAKISGGEKEPKTRKGTIPKNQFGHREGSGRARLDDAFIMGGTLREIAEMAGVPLPSARSHANYIMQVPEKFVQYKLVETGDKYQLVKVK